MSDDQSNQDEGAGGETIAQLREAADSGRKATKKAEALERENAFLKAGIDTDDPKLKYFAKSYDGELTAEAIRAEAEAAGFIGEPDGAGDAGAGGDGGDAATDEDLATQDVATKVRSGAVAPGEQPEADPMVEGFDKFQGRIRKGDRREDAASEVIGRIIGGAVEGNKSFLVE